MRKSAGTSCLITSKACGFNHGPCYVEINNEALLFITRTKARLADVSTLLRDEPFIQYDSNAWGGQIAARYLNESCIKPAVLCELDGLEAISKLVAKGVGNSLVPAWAGYENSDVCSVPISEGQDYNREVVLLHHATPERPKALGLLIELLLK